MWIIGLLVTRPIPHPKVLTCPSTPKMLWIRKRTPTLYFFRCFHFWTRSWVYQGVWGCVINACNWTKCMTFAPCNTPETYNAHSSYIYQSFLENPYNILSSNHYCLGCIWKLTLYDKDVTLHSEFWLVKNLLSRASFSNSNWKLQISSFKSTLDNAFGVLDVGGLYCTLFSELRNCLVGLNTFWRPPWIVPFKVP